MKKYKISEQYTDLPGARYIKHGPFSGELFRDSILIKLLKELKSDEQLELDLDDVYGYPRSFLEEIFGGLVREYNYTYNQFKKEIILISDDEPSLINKIDTYVLEAVEEKKNKEMRSK